MKLLVSEDAQLCSLSDQEKVASSRGLLWGNRQVFLEVSGRWTGAYQHTQVVLAKNGEDDHIRLSYLAPCRKGHLETARGHQQ